MKAETETAGTEKVGEEQIPTLGRRDPRVFNLSAACCPSGSISISLGTKHCPLCQYFSCLYFIIS